MWRKSEILKIEKHYENITVLNITDYRPVNCSQTTGERLASSVASHDLVSIVEGAWGERSERGCTGGTNGLGGGAKVGGRFSAARDPYGLNDEEGWGWGGVNWEGLIGGGGVGKLGQLLRTALHTISISLQNSYCESHNWRLGSWKSLRALQTYWALPVYPVFEDKKCYALTFGVLLSMLLRLIIGVINLNYCHGTRTYYGCLLAQF